MTLDEFKNKFTAVTKRVLKRNISKNPRTLEQYKIDCVSVFNQYTKVIELNIPNNFSESQTHFKYAIQKISEVKQKLNVDLTIPKQPGLEIILSKGKTIKREKSTILDDIDLNTGNLFQLNTLSIGNISIMALATPEFLRLASSHINKNYSGDPLALQSFIDSIRLLETLAVNDQLRQLLISFALTKLEGTAREAIIGIPATINILVNNLTERIRPESSKIIEGKLVALRIDRVTLQVFTDTVNNLADAYRRALISEGIPSAKAIEMTTLKAVEVCRYNARTDIAKSVLASSSFANHKEVVTKYIMEVNMEKQEKSVLAFRTSSYNRDFNTNRPNNRNHNPTNYNHSFYRYPTSSNSNWRTSSSNNYSNLNSNPTNNRGNFNNHNRNFQRSNSNYRDNNRNVRYTENLLVPQDQLGVQQNQLEQQINQIQNLNLD